MLTNMTRTLILYLVLITVMRILGKKQVGQLDPTEFVVILLLSELAAISMQDMNIPLMNCIVPLVTLLCIEILISFLELKSKKLRDLMQGNPVILISNGKIVYDALKSTRCNIDDVMQQLRISGYPDIREVEYAILENSGDLSVVPKSSERPVTVSDLKITPSPSGYPFIVISDGQINKKNMQQCGLSREKLYSELKKHRISSPSELLFAVYDSSGSFYYQKFSKNNSKGDKQ